MKKSKLLLALVLGIFIVFSSCKKKTLTDTENGIAKKEIVTADKKADLLTKEDINWILSNEDKEVMNVDKNLYYLGIALTEIVKDKELLANIEKGVKKSQLNSFPFDDLIVQKNNTENIINKKLSTANFSAFTTEKENLNYVTISNNFRYKGIKYRPVIHIPNLKYADFSLLVIISPGIEVKDNPEKGLENAIIAWKLNDKNEWEETIIGEKTYLYSKNPVLVVSLNIQEDIDIDKKGEKIIVFGNYGNTQKKGKGTWSQSCKEFNIAYRYERSGKSEYAIACFTRYYSGTVVTDADFVIEKVSKNDIGNDISENFRLCYTSSGSQTIFNTYERDGYASNQLLGHLYSIYFYGARKYYNEWYAFNPNTNNETNLWEFPTSGYKTRTSKGHIKFQASTVH